MAVMEARSRGATITLAEEDFPALRRRLMYEMASVQLMYSA